MKTSSRLVIFVALLLLALTVIGAGVTAVPAPYAALPLGSGLALFLLDFMLVLPWYQDGRRKDRRPKAPDWARYFFQGPAPEDPVFPDPDRGPYPTPPREHWGQYRPDVPGARWRHWDDGQ